MVKSKSISTQIVSHKTNGSAPKTIKAVTTSKKNSSKEPTKTKTIVKISEPLQTQDDEEGEDDDEEFSDSSDEEHEDGRDVSERGMKRLMEALGEDGLDDFDAAMLPAGEEDEDADEDEEDDAELGEEEVEGSEDEEDGNDEEEEKEEEEEEEEISTKKSKSKSTSNSNDSLAASILRSGLVPEIESEDEVEDEDEDEEEDPEAEDSGSDNEELLTSNPNEESNLSSHSKKSKDQQQKVYVNNEEAMLRLYEDIRIAGPSIDNKGKGVEMPWIEHMAVSHDQDLGIDDAENDLERELAFYKQSLASTIQAQKRYSTLNIPFSRPNDFFAEMVKTDEHMERVRQRLLDERAGIKASEEAKRQRELKKFGKKVQVEKGLERQRERKRMEESVKGLKRKRQGGLEGDGGEDDFDIRLASGMEEDSNDRGSSSRGRGRGRGKDGRAKMPRNSRDSKYGFGGKKRHAKENTAESTGDFGREKSGRGRGGGRGGRGGGGRGGGRGSSRGGSRGSSRPGKSKRIGRN